MVAFLIKVIKIYLFFSSRENITETLVRVFFNLNLSQVHVLI